MSETTAYVLLFFVVICLIIALGLLVYVFKKNPFLKEQLKGSMATVQSKTTKKFSKKPSTATATAAPAPSAESMTSSVSTTA